MVPQSPFKTTGPQWSRKVSLKLRVSLCDENGADGGSHTSLSGQREKNKRKFGWGAFKT